MQTAVATPAKFNERPPVAAKPRLVEIFAEKYGVDSDKMVASLKATAFRQSGGADQQVSNEQMMMLLVIANEYNLNPFTREIYAFASKGGIVPIVSIDGWVRIVNEKPAFRGVQFEYGPPHADAKYHSAPEWIQCTMHRSDRDVATSVREYLVECFRETDPWKTATSRMLRHRAYMQCGRVAFGFALHDEDEAQRIIEGESSRVSETPSAIAKFNAALGAPVARSAAVTIEPEPSPGEPGVNLMGQPVVTAPAVEAKLVAAANAGDLELLETEASLIGEIADQVHREQTTKVYKTLRADLRKKLKLD